MRYLWPARNIAEPFFNLGTGGGHINIACQHQHGIVRAVVILEPVLHIFHRCCVQITHRTDGGMVIAMSLGEQVFKNIIPQQAKRVVVTLPLFILHDAALIVQHVLCHGTQQMAHAVAFQHQNAVNCAGGYSLEIIGAIRIGGAVHIGAADLFDIFKPFAWRIFRAVEHQMFEQMGKSGLADRFMFGADVIPDGNADQRGLVIFMDNDSQPVVESELFIRNINFGNQFR